MAVHFLKEKEKEKEKSYLKILNFQITFISVFKKTFTSRQNFST